MLHSLNEVEARHERYNDLRREAEHEMVDIEYNNHSRRVFYSPMLAWIGRSLIELGLRIHRRHGKRRFVIVIKPKLA